MVTLETFAAKWSPQLLSIFRIIAAFLFMQHGAQKLLSFPAAPQSEPALLSLIGLAGILELIGGLLLLLGLFTRPVAFVLSGEMAVAYFMAHAQRGFWPLLNGGELAVLYCFAFLYLAAAGGGAWSIDQVWRGRATSPTTSTA
jgi:putative oxidoreductase